MTTVGFILCSAEKSGMLHSVVFFLGLCDLRIFKVDFKVQDFGISRCERAFRVGVPGVRSSGRRQACRVHPP